MYNDYSARWALIGACALGVTAWLMALRIGLDFGSVLPKVEFAGLILLCSAVYAGIGSRVPRLARPLAMLTDCLLSLVQLLAAVTVLLPLTYLAATPGFPLLDDKLAALDAMIGFNWDSVARWVADRPMVDQLFQCAYFSIPLQGAAVLLIGSIRRPGERNGEFIWLLLGSLLITSAIFGFTPAAGKIGHLGTGQIDLLMQIRSGSWSSMSYDHPEGIINFPSFHTTLAIIFPYVMRHYRVELISFTVLNILMLLSIPTVGGHYLVDMFGGAGVAGLSILLVGVVRRYTAHAVAGGGWPIAPRPAMSSPEGDAGRIGTAWPAPLATARDRRVIGS